MSGALDRVAAALARAEEELPRLAAPDGTVAVRIEDLREVLNTHSSGWRDISTAPVNVEVDLWVRVGSFQHRVTDCRATLENGQPAWYTRSDECGWKRFYGTALFWMPLPFSPSGET